MSDKKTQVVLEALKKFLQKGGGISAIKDIADQVNEQVATQEKKNVVTITSAVKLSSDQQASVQTSLEKQFQEGFTYEFAVDKDLIGGLKLKVNDYILDLSLNATINQVVDSLKQ